MGNGSVLIFAHSRSLSSGKLKLSWSLDVQLLSFCYEPYLGRVLVGFLSLTVRVNASCWSAGLCHTDLPLFHVSKE